MRGGERGGLRVGAGGGGRGGGGGLGGERDATEAAGGHRRVADRVLQRLVVHVVRRVHVAGGIDGDADDVVVVGDLGGGDGQAAVKRRPRGARRAQVAPADHQA